MLKDGHRGVKNYHLQLEAQLQEIIVRVRGKLTKIQKKIINALIVIDVHAKDVVDKLWQNEISSADSFEWIRNLRYYIEN